MSLNRVILIGNLGADPELKYTNGGTACELRLATTESWKDKNGQKQEKTEWHRVVVWGKTAEIAGKYLEKGREVCIEGKLQTRSYDDRDGNKRYITEVVCQNLVLLRGGGREGGGRRGDDGPPPPDHGGGGGYSGPGPDDDIPFIASALELEPTAVAALLRGEV